MEKALTKRRSARKIVWSLPTRASFTILRSLIPLSIITREVARYTTYDQVYAGLNALFPRPFILLNQQTPPC